MTLDKEDLEKIPCVESAAFDSAAGAGVKCYRGTRECLRHEIKTWAEDPHEKCIFWLKGAAGTGKSTIARTVAQDFDDNDQLGASFFFSRFEAERNNPLKFFTTIATHLSQKVPGLVPYIKDAIKKEPMIASKTLEKQFKSLILQPLNELQATSSSGTPGDETPQPLVLVFDALDECGDDEKIKEIVCLLAKVQELKAVQMRIFLTSRPEFLICRSFNRISSMHKSKTLQDEPLTKTDISTFLRKELSTIKSDFDADWPNSQLPADWPGEESIQKLAEMATPLFVFATTVCLFIEDTIAMNPQEQLDTILKSGVPQGDPDSKLYQTYRPVLKQIENRLSKTQIEKFGQEFRKIIGSIIILMDPLPISPLAHLLGVSESEVTAKLMHLKSVLHVPDDSTTPVRLLHLSFREVLISSYEISDNPWFRINEEKAHSMMTTRCLRVLSSYLKEDVCSLEYPGMLRRKLSTTEIEKALPKHAQYACLYWVHHLEHSGTNKCLADVYEFLRKYFLYWLEALSFLGGVSKSLNFVDTLSSLTDRKEGSKLQQFLYDAKRFLLQNWQIIDKAPLQAYSSAIIFSPETSIIRNLFWDHIPEWIDTDELPTPPKFWGAELQKLEGHRNIIHKLIFSPSNKYLASASRDFTIRIWDVATGQEVRIFEGQDGIEAIGFCSEGEELASVSIKGRVIVWDIATGQQVKNFKIAPCPSQERHEDFVADAIFSSNSEELMLVLGSSAIQVWNIREEKRIKIFRGRDWVRAAAFSPDGKRVAFSCWYNGTINIRNLETGCAISMDLEANQGRFSEFEVAFSPDGRHLVSITFDTVRVWDIADGRLLRIFEKNPSTPRAATFSSDGRYLAWMLAIDVNETNIDTASVLEVLDMTTQQVKTVGGRGSESASAVAISPDGKYLASSGRASTTIRLWDAMAEGPQDVLSGREPVSMVAFSHNGNLLVSVSDYTVKLWDAKKKKKEPEVLRKKGYERIGEVAFSPNDMRLALVVSDAVELWDITERSLIAIPTHQRGFVGSVAFSNDGKILALLSFTGVSLWNIDGTIAQKLKVFEIDRPAVALSFDGHQVAMGYRRWSNRCPESDDLIILWDTWTGKLVKTFRGHKDLVLALAFSPDGNYLASASRDRTIRLWDIATNRQTGCLELQTMINSLRFSRDGKCLETNRGLFDISDFQSLSQRPGHPFLLNGEWITQGRDNFLWLPADYRGTCSAFCRGHLAIGQTPGEVCFFRFRDEHLGIYRVDRK
ncbi:hypothetical protein TWF718_005190 [Orbilia javanica]|uniref:NACHT domain-containing protein n=1 Tax=Orbilia javanica TaxID=47235 RepID=A0AAN8P0J3_9PEZI